MHFRDKKLLLPFDSDLVVRIVLRQVGLGDRAMLIGLRIELLVLAG